MFTYRPPHICLIFRRPAVIVAYDPAAHTQEFFRAHTDDVVCLAQHPRRRDVIATGQMATVTENGRSSDPFACVYDWASQQTWQLPPMAGQRKVVSLAFSGDGRFLATAGCDNDFTITVWDWENKSIVATAKSANKVEITHLAFQGGHDARPGTYEICAVGPKAVTFYYLGAGGRAPLTVKQGKLGAADRPNFLCACYTADDTCVVGAEVCISHRDELNQSYTPNQLTNHDNILFAFDQNKSKQIRAEYLS